MVPAVLPSAGLLRPYLPRLTVEWLRETPHHRARSVDGTLAFVDISGFTRMTERLARRGKVGAEEVSDILDACFDELLAVSDADGADLIKWGGDAVLLLFRGPDHATRACRAAAGMRRTMRRVGQLRTSAGRVTLRMSVGIHSGTFHFFLIGDLHRELVLTGPGATVTARMEQIAEAGEIVVSPATAALLEPALVGATKEQGLLLRGSPPGPPFGSQAAPDADGLDLAACLPVAIREHLVSGALPGEAEHRPVSAAFIEFRGTDALLAGDDLQPACDALQPLLARVQAAAEANGVSFFETDINQDGGKIMLIAGAPRTGGHDEEGMLRALRATIEAGGGPLALRIGVNSGRVFAGGFGPTFRRTYSVKGDAVNLAARLMAKAPPGAIFATEGVLMRSRTIFEATRLEPFMVKGKARPVQAFDVGRPAGARAAEVERPDLPLVGREAEVGTLVAAMDAARHGTGRVVELVGEPGIGKSRLVSELRRRASDVRTLQVTCDEYGTSSAYLPFRGLLRELIGVPFDADRAAAGARLRARVEATAGQLAPWLPLLAIPLDAAVAPTPEADALAERFRKPRLEAAVSELMAQLLAEPTLLVFDDVHTMDEASSALLRRLASDVAARPWLIVDTRRELDSGFIAPRIEPMTVLRLAPLDEATAATALGAATEEAPLAPHIVAALVQRSGGNPLFLQELLAAARRAGGIEDLPDTVEGVIAAQLDRLPPGDRLLLRYASVVGVSFDDELLGEVLAADRQERPTEAHWRRLQGIVVRDPGGTRRFLHALIRDAAYERLAYRRRRELHARVGEAILRRFGAASDEQAALLSLHFLNAGRFDAAWRYSRLAGDHARGAYANVEAAELYARALEAARRLRTIPAGETAAVLEELGEARMRLGEFGAAESAFRAARQQRAGDAVGQARLLLKMSLTESRRGRHVQAMRWISRGRGLLQELDDPGALGQRARLTVRYGGIKQDQGRAAEAVRWCRRAIVEAEASGARDALAHAYYILDWALRALGRTEELPYSRLALAIYEELGDIGAQSKVLNNLGIYAYREGRWDDAVAYYERARAAFQRIGALVDAAFPASNMAEILADQGRFDEAEPLLRGAIRVWKAAGDRSGVAEATAILARVAARTSRVPEALSLLADARATYLEEGERIAVLETDLRVAECLLREGNGHAALAIVDDARARADGLGAAYLRPMILRLTGAALALTGQVALAGPRLEEAVGDGRGRRADYEVALALDALAQLPTLAPGPRARHAAARDEMLERLGVRFNPGFSIEPRRADPS